MWSTEARFLHRPIRPWYILHFVHFTSVLRGLRLLLPVDHPQDAQSVKAQFLLTTKLYESKHLKWPGWIHRQQPRHVQSHRHRLTNKRMSTDFFWKGRFFTFDTTGATWSGESAVIFEVASFIPASILFRSSGLRRFLLLFLFCLCFAMINIYVKANISLHAGS